MSSPSPPGGGLQEPLHRHLRQPQQRQGEERVGQLPRLRELFSFTDRNCNTVTQVSYENASQSNCQSPLVIQHPLFGRKENHSSLGRMISHLTKRTVVIPDARNHGNSPKCDNPSIKQMSTDLVDFQKQLKIRQSCLLGFSTGGRVAMMTALLHPQSGGNIVMLRLRRGLEHNFS